MISLTDAVNNFPGREPQRFIMEEVVVGWGDNGTH